MKFSVEQIKEMFKELGEIYTIFKYKGQYAVKLKDGTETLYVITNDGLELHSMYDLIGSNFSANGIIIYSAGKDFDDSPLIDDENN